MTGGLSPEDSRGGKGTDWNAEKNGRRTVGGEKGGGGGRGGGGGHLGCSVQGSSRLR